MHFVLEAPHNLLNKPNLISYIHAHTLPFQPARAHASLKISKQIHPSTPNPHIQTQTQIHSLPTHLSGEQDADILLHSLPSSLVTSRALLLPCPDTNTAPPVLLLILLILRMKLCFRIQAR